MILNRVIKHLREQHWTAVFLDLVIVVVGVFLGLQAQDWNQARQDRALEHKYLERLRNDFAQSVKDAQSNIKRMQREFRLEGLMVARLRACHLDVTQRADFAQGIYLAGRFEPPPLVRGTIDELRSSGRMAIIEDLTLRQKISETVRAQDREAQVLGYIIDRATPELIYFDRRSTLVEPHGGFENPNQARQPGAVLFDFTSLCHDPSYVGAVSAVQELTRVVIGHNEARLKDYRSLVAMIDGELAKGR